MALGPAHVLLEFADRSRLLTLVLLFIFLGLIETVTLATTFTFRCFAEMVDAYYDFRGRVARSRSRFHRTVMKGGADLR
jgi:hypothetical protein